MQLTNYMTRDRTLHVQLSGKLTYCDCNTVKPLILGATDQQVAHLVIDLSYLSFIDSTSVGFLVTLAEAVRKMGATMSLRHAQGQVERVLTAAHALDPFLKPQKIRSTPESAIRMNAPAPPAARATKEREGGDTQLHVFMSWARTLLHGFLSTTPIALQE